MMTLVLADNRRMEVPRQTALRCGMIECAVHFDTQANEIEIPLVGHKTMTYIIQWMTLNPTLSNSDTALIPMPVYGTILHTILPSGNAQFFGSRTLKELRDIIKAADYLYIDPLLQMACATYSVLLKNKTATELAFMNSGHGDNMTVSSLIKHMRT